MRPGRASDSTRVVVGGPLDTDVRTKLKERAPGTGTRNGWCSCAGFLGPFVVVSVFCKHGATVISLVQTPASGRAGTVGGRNAPGTCTGQEGRPAVPEHGEGTAGDPEFPAPRGTPTPPSRLLRERWLRPSGPPPEEPLQSAEAFPLPPLSTALLLSPCYLSPLRSGRPSVGSLRGSSEWPHPPG